ncbi:von Willebrand factor type A domain-containing protein [bacterium]|nr:von Willebrand factor type A domain-containing protein [bacterium]
MRSGFKHDRHRLSDHEREALWFDVRRATLGPGAVDGTPRGSFLPALATTAAVAGLVLLAVWRAGPERIDAVRRAPVQAPVVVEVAPVVAPPPRAEAGPAQTVARTGDQGAGTAAPPPSPAGLRGRVVDSETGEALAWATVLVRGTALSTSTDANGDFFFPDLPREAHVDLMVQMLGYDPVDVATDVPADGRLPDDVALVSRIVETLQPFDVEGAEYMVEVRNAVTEHKVSSETFEKYAIDSVEAALSKKAGVATTPGRAFVRGGRSGEVSMSIDGAAEPMPRGSAGAAPAPGEYRLQRPGAPAGSVTGGTQPPNGAQAELMYFESAGVNPFVATEDDALSTFATDVDDASWTMARNYLDRGQLPPPEAIRVEEFVNAFDAGWPVQDEAPFRIHADGSASPYGKGYRLLRIGLVGQHIPDEERKPADLVFVIDVSGSMAREERLGTVKRALHGLVAQLREGDRVGIVVYGSNGQVLLPLTGAENRDLILGVIDGLGPGGSTNAAEGLELGYRMAREAQQPGVISRLILCSDGVANNGVSTEAGGILDAVRRASDEGITLSTVGFGMGNYNDVLMEKLADQGDGNYSYVDSQEEADRVFRENLTGRLQTIAREVKVQVEFDPARVRRWRLLGYENRDVADEDFRNDAVDAGEVGADHQVTALYEVKLEDAEAPEWDGVDLSARRGGDARERIGTIRLRWEAPAHDTAHAGMVTEIERPLRRGDVSADAADGSLALRVQTVVAEFAEILRGSYWAKGRDAAALVPEVDRLLLEARNAGGYDTEKLADLRRLVRQAADLAASQPKR